MSALSKSVVSSCFASILIASGASYAAPPAPPFVGGNSNISRIAPVAGEDDTNPAVAYDSVNDQYLVVWWGDSATTGLNNFEVFGRRLGGKGVAAGAPFRLSFTGPVDVIENDALIAREPDVTYNPNTGEFLVVWYAHVGGNDVEVFGQRVTPFGTLQGGNFQISNTNATNAAGNAQKPAVTQAGDNGYLVVWQADGTPVDNEFEIFGRMVSADGSTPSPEFRISSQGTDGDISTEAVEPDVAYRPGANQFFVVWKGDVSGTDDFEIFGKQIDLIGAPVSGTLPVSFPNPAAGAEHPVVVRNSTSGELLVVWRENVGSQILGRVLGAGAKPAGANLQISAPGQAPAVEGLGNNGIGAAYNPVNNEFLVNWPGGGIKGRVVKGDASLPNPVEDFSTQIGELSADVTYNPTAHEYFTVFDADGGTKDKVVYGQRRAAPQPVSTPANPTP